MLNVRKTNASKTLQLIERFSMLSMYLQLHHKYLHEHRYVIGLSTRGKNQSL